MEKKLHMKLRTLFIAENKLLKALEYNKQEMQLLAANSN
jgi:hypothetical protein